MSQETKGKWNKEGLWEGPEYVCSRCRRFYSNTLETKTKCEEPYKNHKWEEYC